MQLGKYIFWMLFFTVGIGLCFPSCDDGLNCNCPPIKGDFFDIQGIQELELSQYKGTFVTDADGNQLVNWDDLKVQMEFEQDFFGQLQDSEEKKPNWGFSLLPAAYACSCIEDGWRGSTEVIENLEVFTKNDFDESHPAGSDISDLIMFDNYEEEVLLKEYLEREENVPVFFPALRLYLTQAPSELSDFGVRIRITLDNEEVHEGETSSTVKLR